MRRLISAVIGSCFFALSIFFSRAERSSRAADAKQASEPKARAEHVVIVVWDGLRPDSVTERDTPALFRMGQTGTTFANHHSVYVSSTEANGAALATGCYPVHDGIMANSEYRPTINAEKAINTESLQAIRKGDELTDGHFVAMPTLAERVQQAGRRTAVAGTKAVALLQDRRLRSGDNASAVLFGGETIPSTEIDALKTAHGEFPKIADSKTAPNVAEDAWTTQSLIDVLWAKELPALSVLWLSEPDYAQHGAGPNSEVAKKALRSSDDNLARVLQALEDKKLRDKTDVFVVSDHGFSTIGRAIDAVEILNDAGFQAFKSFKKKPVTGDTMVVGLGGTSLLYVTDHDKRTAQRLVEFLQTSDIAGVIFSRFEFEGTFPLAVARIDTRDAPDIVVSLKWTDEPSKTGMRGLDISDPLKRGVGQGIHASLSPYDMHNTLIAAGPDFRSGWIDKLPSGNVDVAPTALAILGIASNESLDGRVLGEALVGRAPPDREPVYEKLEARRDTASGKWRQYLRTMKLGPYFYIDEGNGGVEK